MATPTPAAAAAPRNSLALKRWQFLLLTAIGLLALGLVFLTTSLSGNIGTLRGQLDERQTFINETMLLSRLNVQLAQVLANLAVATNDDQLRQVLNDNGITFSVERQQGSQRASIAPGAAAGGVLRPTTPAATPATTKATPPATTPAGAPR